MSNLVTILTCSSQFELATIIPLLEAEGIETFTKDELTVQVTQYSSAFGGIKLQVKESDAEYATAILKEKGYIAEEENTPPAFLIKLEKFTSEIPFIKKYSFEVRLLLTGAVLITIFAVLFYYLTKPDVYDALVDHTWCVEHINYKGQDYMPNTHEFKVIFRKDCNEIIVFNPNGNLHLPGFNSRGVYAYWLFDEDSIEISNADTLAKVYNGNYEIELSQRQLILKSAETIIYCKTNL
ncbi:MAG: hypothetical protein POELPBGB_00898 [Bacteroidia bacterium]|nr:hypothetical protein [Bacteroidia bacterium]